MECVKNHHKRHPLDEDDRQIAKLIPHAGQNGLRVDIRHLPCMFQFNPSCKNIHIHSTLPINNNNHRNNTYLCCCVSVMLVASQIVKKPPAPTCVPVVHLHDNYRGYWSQGIINRSNPYRRCYQIQT